MSNRSQAHETVPKVQDFPDTGTPFQIRVWKALLQIPRGKTITYKELAKKVGAPCSIRAVANAVAANPHPVSIPCHRIVRSDGGLGGYSGPGGVEKKRLLLKREGVLSDLSR